MPGDINTYALGIEFNLSAAKAIDTLHNVHDQAVKIQETFNKGVQLQVDNTGLQQQNQLTEIHAGLLKEVEAGFKDNEATLTDLQKELSGAAATADEFTNINKKYASTITTMERGLVELEKAGLQGSAEARALREQLYGFKDALGDYKEGVDEATAAWERQQKQASQALDNIVGMVGQISPGISGAIGKVRNVVGAFQEARESAAAMAKQSADPKAGAGLADVGSKAADAASNLGEIKKAGGAMSKTMASGSKAAAGGMAKAGAATGGMGGMMAKANPYILAASVALEGVLAAANAVGGALDAMGMSSSEAGKAVVEFVKTLNPLKLVLGMVTAAIGEFLSEQEALSTATYQGYGDYKAHNEALREMQTELKLTSKESIEVRKALKESGLFMIANSKEIKKYTKLTAQFNIGTGVSAKTTAKFVQVMKASGVTYEKTKRLLGKYTIAMKEMGMSAEEAAGMLDKLVKMGPQIKALFNAEAVEKFGRAFAGLSKDFVKTGLSAENAMGVIAELADPMSRLSKISGITGRDVEDTTVMMEKLGRAVNRHTKNWSNLNATVRTLKAQKVFGKSAAEVDGLMRSMAKYPTVEAWAAAMTKSKDAAKEAGAVDEAAAKKKENFADFMKRMWTEILPPLKEAFEKIQPVVEQTLKGTLLPLIKDIMKSVPDIILLFKDVAKVIGAIFNIGRVVWAFVKGFFEGWYFVMEPIIEAIGTIISVIGDLFGGVNKDGKQSTSTIEGLIKVAKWLGRAFGVIANVVALPFTLGLRMLKWFSEKIGDLKRLLFGSSFLHIEEGIEVIKKPLIWLRDAFMWVWEKVKSLAGTVKGFLGNVIPTGVSVAKKAVNLLLAPFKAVGSAIGWVKDKLFGSSMLHLKEGAAAVAPSVKSLGKDFMNLGAAASTQSLKTSKYYAQAVRDIKGFAHFSKKQQEAILKTYDSPGGRALAAVQGQAAQAARLANESSFQKMRRGLGFGEPIRREMDQEMGRTSKEAEQIKIMNMTLAKMGMVIIKIAEMLEASGKSPEEITELLKKYLPKMAERPADLGPAVAMW